MENYQLKENEKLFYKGKGILIEKKGKTEIILTNINIVFITKQKKFFAKEIIDIELYPIENIKKHKGLPQIILNNKIVDISLTTTNKKFKFNSKEDANQFISATKKLLTSKLTLCYSKIKKTLKNSKIVKQVGGTLKAIVSGTIIKLVNQGINKLGQAVSKALHLP